MTADKAAVGGANHPSHSVNNRPICGVAAGEARAAEEEEEEEKDLGGSDGGQEEQSNERAQGR